MAMGWTWESLQWISLDPLQHQTYIGEARIYIKTAAGAQWMRASSYCFYSV
jgi:hypothetical protein